MCVGTAVVVGVEVDSAGCGGRDLGGRGHGGVGGDIGVA